MDRIDAYLRELRRLVPWNIPARRRWLGEITDHLHDAVETATARGVARDEAVQGAIDRLGEPARLAAAFRASQSVRRRAARVAAVAVVCCAAGVVGVVQSQGSGHQAGGRSVRAEPVSWVAPLRPEPGAALRAVAASGANDVWAVGDRQLADRFETVSLVEHWDGKQWRTVSCPNIGPLVAISVPAPGVMWAAGQLDVLNSNHGHCSAMRIPRIHQANITTIDAVTPASVWVAGSREGKRYAPHMGGTYSFVAHWNGTSWRIFKPPNPSDEFDQIASILALSPRNVWAVGSSMLANTRTLALHWNGTTWSQIRTPNPPKHQSTLDQIAVTPSGALWSSARRRPAIRRGRSPACFCAGTVGAGVQSPSHAQRC